MKILWTLLGLAACASPPPEHALGSAPPLLDGIEALSEDVRWRVGDYVTLELVVTRDGKSETRLVRLEVEAALEERRPFRYTWKGVSYSRKLPLLQVLVDVYDESGTLLAADREQIPETYLTTGFIGLTAEAESELAPDSIFAITTILEIIRGSDALSPLFWRVVDRPPLLSFLGGVHFSIHARASQQTRQQDDPPGGGDARDPFRGHKTYLLPVSLELNGAPAVNLELTILEPQPPLLLTGGMLSMRAQHPTLDRQADLRVVGAGRGTGEAFLRQAPPARVD